MPSRTKSNLAGRMGAWSARHRKAAVLGWLGFVVVAVLLGYAAHMKMLTAADSRTGESAQAQRIIDSAGIPNNAQESVLVQNHQHSASDPAFRAAVAAVADAVRAQPHVHNVRSPLDSGGQALVSRDGHSAVVQFALDGNADEQMQRITGPLGAVAATQQHYPTFRIEEFGDASFARAAHESAGSDFKRAEILSVPVTVLILL